MCCLPAIYRHALVDELHRWCQTRNKINYMSACPLRIMQKQLYIDTENRLGFNINVQLAFNEPTILLKWLYSFLCNWH